MSAADFRKNPANFPFLTKRFLHLNPVNATSNSQYSARSGLPLIKFDVASTALPTLLDAKELRISGQITYSTGAGAKVTSQELNFVDGFCGTFANCIEHVALSSKRLASTIERNNNYFRQVPSLVSAMNTGSEINNKMYNNGGHTATTPLQRHQIGAYNDFGATTRATDGVATQVGRDFSAPLYCGLLHSGDDINLASQSGQGGLTIEILLKSDVNVLFGDDANANNGTFSVKNLVLTCPVYEVASEAAPAFGEAVTKFSFNSWSSMFQTMNSSTSVIAFTPGISRCSSMFMNSMNTNELGNQNFNSCRLGNIGEVRQIRYTLNGALTPFQFRLQTNEQANNRQMFQTNRAGGQSLQLHSNSSRPMTLMPYLEAVKTDGIAKVHGTSMAWNSWSSGVVDRSQIAGRTGVTPSTCAGFGVLYDRYGSGTDLSLTTWAIELECAANATLGVNAEPLGLTGGSTTSQGVYLFFLSKNDLMYSATGVTVIR